MEKTMEGSLPVPAGESRTAPKTKARKKTKKLPGMDEAYTWKYMRRPDHGARMYVRVRPSVKIALTKLAKSSNVDISMLISNILEYAVTRKISKQAARMYSLRIYSHRADDLLKAQEKLRGEK